MRFLSYLLTLLFALLVAACGGGGGSPGVVPNHPVVPVVVNDDPIIKLALKDSSGALTNSISASGYTLFLATVARTFGSFARLEELLRATAMSEAGGSGWTILGLSLHTGALTVSWSGNHTQTPAATLPLLVVDMYEHAYALDHGAAAAKYVDAFFANVRWDVVDRRLASAQKAKAALSP